MNGMKMQQKAKKLAENRKALYDYEILETYEAGLKLFGHEVKAIKAGHISLKGSYVVIKDQEAFLINSLISPYQEKNTPDDYDKYRSRKLLLRKKEIQSLIGKSKQKRLTLIPIKIYTKKNLIKLEFGIGKGKREIDKRQKIKKREFEIEKQREFRGR